MRKTCIIPALAAVLLGASPALGSGAERYEDAVGDAIGESPDIVAVEVDEREGPVLRFSVIFASEPPLAANADDTDILWLALDTAPEVSLPELDGFSITAMAGTLPRDQEMGSHLLAGDDLYWHVVDVATDGPAVIFRVDRKLLGDPAELWFRVYAAALHGSLYTEQVDHYPEKSEPPAFYRLSQRQD